MVEEQNIDNGTDALVSEYELSPDLPGGKVKGAFIEMIPVFTFFGNDVYLFAPLSITSWSSLNLLLIAAGIFISLKTIICSVLNENKGSIVSVIKEDEKYRDLWLHSGIAICLFAIVLFTITQDITSLIAIFNLFTIGHVALMLAQIVTIKAYKSFDLCK